MQHKVRLKSVSVFAPATVANVGSAFDVLGFALSAPGDALTLTASSEPGIRITSISGDGGKLPFDSTRNTATVAIAEFCRAHGILPAFDVSIEKQMPLGSGLGSSAASAAAGAVAVNELFGAPFSRKELVRFAMEGERIACGSAHADNAAPAILGSFVLIRSYDPLDTIVIEAPPELTAVVVHPHIEIRTEDARKILKKQVLLKSAIIQWGNAAGLVAGLLKHDYELIGRSLHDEIIEPERSLLIPGFSQVKKAAIDNGALGCSISGSGPSIFSLTQGLKNAERVGAAMVNAFSSIAVESDLHISTINPQGVQVTARSNI